MRMLILDRRYCGANRQVRADCEICTLSLEMGCRCEKLTTVQLTQPASVNEGLNMAPGDNDQTFVCC